MSESEQIDQRLSTLASVGQFAVVHEVDQAANCSITNIVLDVQAAQLLLPQRRLKHSLEHWRPYLDQRAVNLNF